MLLSLCGQQGLLRLWKESMHMIFNYIKHQAYEKIYFDSLGDGAIHSGHKPMLRAAWAACPSQ